MCEAYLAEAALAQHGEEVEVIDGVLLKPRYGRGRCGDATGPLELRKCVGRLCGYFEWGRNKAHITVGPTRGDILRCRTPGTHAHTRTRTHT